MTQPTGYIFGAMLGALMGLITFLEGRHRGQQQTGLAGFLACTIAGAFGGFLFTLLAMLCFTIAMRAEARTQPTLEARHAEAAGRWRRQLTMLAVGCTTCLMLLAGQQFYVEREQRRERAMERQREVLELNATLAASTPTP